MHDGSRRYDRALLLAACALAIALRLYAAVAWPNIVWPDEIFQTLEQAHRLVFGYGVVPWEFAEGARSWLLPGALAAPMAAGAPLGGHAPIRAAQVALALASLVPVVAAFRLARPRHGLVAALVAAAACASWFELVFFGAKALNEVVAAHALVLGLLLLRDEPRRSRVLAAGACLGLAAALRMHLVPAIAAAAPFALRRDARRWGWALAGAAAPILLAGALDAVTWGTPFRSYWANFQFNVVEGSSARFGVLPWDAYLRMLGETWSWAGLVLVPLAALGAWRHPSLGAAGLATLATHSLFAHKEYRFVYPAVCAAVLLAAIATAELVARARGARRGWAAGLAVLAWVGASAAGARSFRTYETPQSAWTDGRGGIQALALAGADPGTCGVALADVHWGWTGGYTWLRRDVPMFIAGSPDELVSLLPHVDALIVPPALVAAAPEMPGLRVERCWDDVCLLRKAGGCAPAGDRPTISAQLAAARR